MEKKMNNEELQSRREFFKKAAKGALPILGAIALAAAPTIVKAAETPQYCNYDCTSSCRGGCAGCQGTCRGGCESLCGGNCSGSCSGSCAWGCTGYVKNG